MDPATQIAILSAFISAISAAAATTSVYISRKSLNRAEYFNTKTLELSQQTLEQSRQLTIETFKRQGIINLHMAWRDINAIDPDPSKIIVPDVAKAVNALDLTASLWNHDVIGKEILLQSYWPTYRDIYETLNSITYVINGLKKTGKDLLTREITRAYEEMKEKEINSVIKTWI